MYFQLYIYKSNVCLSASGYVYYVLGEENDNDKDNKNTT